MKESAARYVTGSEDTGFRAGLGSCILHAIFFCLLVGGPVLYRHHIAVLPHPPTLETPVIEAAPITLVLQQLTEPPSAPPAPVLPPAPAIPPIAVAPTTPLHKAKLASHKRNGAAVHHSHKPARPRPLLTQPPVAQAVLPRHPPRALPLLAPPPVIKTAKAKLPARALPVGPLPVIARPLPPRPSEQALAPKPSPAVSDVIPTLPRVPPPRALPVVLPPAPIPVLAPMPPPRALAVAPPAPIIPRLAAVPPPRALPVPLPPAVVPAPAPAPPPPAAATVPPVAPATPAPVPENSATASDSTVFTPVDGPDATSFPQPPYPYSAKIQRMSGTVVMNVQFDGRGRVIYAEVAHSSGFPLLDEETRAFIRKHWHLPTYAGLAVSVPVEYRLNFLGNP